MSPAPDYPSTDALVVSIDDLSAFEIAVLRRLDVIVDALALGPYEQAVLRRLDTIVDALRDAHTATSTSERRGDYRETFRAIGGAIDRLVGAPRGESQGHAVESGVEWFRRVHEPMPMQWVASSDGDDRALDLCFAPVSGGRVALQLDPASALRLRGILDEYLTPERCVAAQLECERQFARDQADYERGPIHSRIECGTSSRDSNA